MRLKGGVGGLQPNCGLYLVSILDCWELKKTMTPSFLSNTE